MMSTVLTILMWAIVALIALAVIANWKKVVAGWHGARAFGSQVAFEMTKVAWPSREEVVNSTVLVGIIVSIMAVLLYVVDLILAWAVQLLIY